MNVAIISNSVVSPEFPSLDTFETLSKKVSDAATLTKPYSHQIHAIQSDVPVLRSANLLICAQH